MSNDDRQGMGGGRSVKTSWVGNAAWIPGGVTQQVEKLKAVRARLAEQDPVEPAKAKPAELPQVAQPVTGALLIASLESDVAA